VTYDGVLYSFIETKLFSRLLPDYLTDDEYASLQAALVEAPERGALVPGSGGVRKLRWPQPGRGKRGGIRVIYYAMPRQGIIWMLTIYAKNEEQSIPAHVLRRIKEEIDG
jgi:mRNA-degrading endonuclease RelE of RelBE toxin-antitoxin system